MSGAGRICGSAVSDSPGKAFLKDFANGSPKPSSDHTAFIVRASYCRSRVSSQVRSWQIWQDFAGTNRGVVVPDRF